ncbi:MAG: tetratricopeptide repeat protein, partial [Anaerolineae bacterium]|nr:tetratricopeptide repeat protein [Anaerolineae bacterium]
NRPYCVLMGNTQASTIGQPDPNTDQDYNNRGVDRFRAGDIKGALADFDEAVRCNPSYAVAYANRGAVRHKAGDLIGALADFDEALRLDIFDAVTYYNRGTVRYHLGDFSEALGDFDRAIRYQPGDCVEVYNNRGEAHLALGHYQHALADFEKALDAMPGYPYAIAGLALTLHASGCHEEALSRWLALVDAEPRYRDAAWVGEELNWAPALIEIADRLIRQLP